MPYAGKKMRLAATFRSVRWTGAMSW